MYKHLVVAVDGSATALNALKRAADLASAVNAKLTLVNVANPAEYMALAPEFLQHESYEAAAVAQGNEVLDIPESTMYRKGVGGSHGAFVMGTEVQQQRIPRATKNLKLGDWPVYTDIISGKAPGRTSREQITHYRTIGNWGVQFSSVGSLVYRKAKAAGLGHELPTEWFLQDIRN